MSLSFVIPNPCSYLKQVMLKDGAALGSGSLYAGQSGDIKLEVEDSLSLLGFFRVIESLKV